MIKKIYNFRSRALRPSLDSNYSQEEQMGKSDISKELGNSENRRNQGSLTLLITKSYDSKLSHTPLDNLINCKSYCKSICKKEINDICGLRAFLDKKKRAEEKGFVWNYG